VLKVIDSAGNPTEEHVLPASEAPRLLYLIRFPLPALLYPSARSGPTQLWTWAHRGDLAKLKSRFGGAGHVAGRYDEIAFARQMAKIAHSYVTAEHPAIESYEPLLPQFILTGVGDYRSLVGCGTAPLDSDTRTWLCNIHWGRVTVDSYAYLISRFKLFAFTSAPVYEVIVARKHLSLGPLEPVSGQPIER
jgi:hypothetical protein